MTTALSVTLPLALITIILLRLVIAAKRRKAVTGDQGMIGELGVVQADLARSAGDSCPGDALGVRISVRVGG